MRLLSKTYRFLSSLLCLFILAGIAVPTGLHAETMSSCSMEHASMMDHDMSSDMDHSNGHDMPSHSSNEPCNFGFSCMCSIEEAPLETDAPSAFTQHIVVSVLETPIETLDEISSSSTATPSFYFVVEEYSPPIFLLNQSFLN